MTKGTVYFFNSGNTAFCDEDGKQVPKLQESWFLLYIKFLEKNKVDIENCQFNLPGNRKAKPFKIGRSKKWNWELVD